MTQTEQVNIYQLMLDACTRFYEVFDIIPERVFVSWMQKPHIIPVLPIVFRSPLSDPAKPAEYQEAHIPVETYKPLKQSKLNWDEFLLYSPQTGRMQPEDLAPSATLFKKMIEARGYGVLVNSNHPALDTFYIFHRDRYIPWAYSKFAYEHMHIATLKAELEAVLKRFPEEQEA